MLVRFLAISLHSFAFIASVSAANASLVVSSFDGFVTDEELASFDAFVTSLTPQDDNLGNKWAYGNSGTQLRAMGVVYQISKRRSTLDQMIRFCDKSLSIRNDLLPPPTGQKLLWTGDIGPAWPNQVSTEPISTGGEQGDPVGGLAYCASLIISTPDLHDENVTIGDPYGYGATYLDRAMTFLQQADYSMSNHILSRVLDLSNQTHMYFAKDDPYKGGQAVPWNQAVMFTYPFQYLIDAHTMLGDNDTLVASYSDIMNANIDWFFLGDGSSRVEGPAGRTVYDYDYLYDSGTVEDATHAKMDIQGYYIAYTEGRWSVGSEQMQVFANTLIDVMILPNGTFAGTVTGQCGDTKHSACTNSLRQGYVYLAEFAGDHYESIMKAAGVNVGNTTVGVDVYSQFLWVKNLRATQTSGDDPQWRAYI